LLKQKDKVKCTFLSNWCIAEYQNKAVTAILLKECYETFKEKAYSTVIEHRISKQLGYSNLWKLFDPVVHKRRCTFIKFIKNSS
jgi:hypothetical protein